MGVGVELLPPQPEIAEMPQKSRVKARILRRRRRAGRKNRRARKVVLRGKVWSITAVCMVEFTVIMVVATVVEADKFTVAGETVQVGG